MDRIEQLVRLPQGAFPLNRYARYYGLLPGGTIEAVYLETTGIPGDLSAGDRRWVGDAADLPAVNDGGCHVVSVSFDPIKATVRAFCNGVA